MSTYGFPDICGFYAMLYGTAGVDLQSITCLYFGNTTGAVFSGNPPFTVTDFISVYPKFVGPATNFTELTIQSGSNIITGFTSTTGLSIGQLVVNTSLFQSDSIITTIDSIANTITISNPALSNGSIMAVYESPFIPILVIKTYITLALASVMQARYKEAWFICMCYFVAHYCTLFMRSESGEPNVTASQVASSGLTKGIIVQRSAGDVSATSKVIEGFEEFGAWRETQYGELFITIARAVSAGPIWIR